MPTTTELKKKFWDSLKSDRTVMLGLPGTENGHTRPMTAQVDSEEGPIWFFTSRETHIVKNLNQASDAVFTFVSKGHDLFAVVQGTLSFDQDRYMLEKLWNPFVAAWFEEGKADPKLALLRFDADAAEIWLNGSSLLAGIKILLGVDPKKDYKDHVAKVRLN